MTFHDAVAAWRKAQGLGPARIEVLPAVKQVRRRGALVWRVIGKGGGDYADYPPAVINRRREKAYEDSMAELGKTARLHEVRAKGVAIAASSNRAKGRSTKEPVLAYYERPQIKRMGRNAASRIAKIMNITSRRVRAILAEEKGNVLRRPLDDTGHP